MGVERREGGEEVGKGGRRKGREGSRAERIWEGR